MDGLDESKFWLDAMDRMIGRVRETRDANLAGFPHYGDQDTGEWTTSPDGFWTGGFWVGELWLAARLTGDASYNQAARNWLKRLEPRIDSRSVFRGSITAQLQAPFCKAIPSRRRWRSGPPGRSPVSLIQSPV
jgi:unsaturated chondroitin disaccharide hydrolase